MISRHLSNDEFLSRLTTLLTNTHAKSRGSIFLSQKTLDESSSTLVRATNGASKPHRTADPASKIKLSTTVANEDLVGFYAKYAEVCKRGMEGLRKRERKKKKAKAKKGGKAVGTVAG